MLRAKRERFLTGRGYCCQGVQVGRSPRRPVSLKHVKKGRMSTRMRWEMWREARLHGDCMLSALLTTLDRLI